MEKFETEKSSKILISLAVPVIIKSIIFEMYNLVDTFFVGRYVGNAAIAALMVVFPVQRLFFAINALIGQGASSLFSRYMGAERKDKAVTVSKTGFYLVFIIMLPLMFLVNVFSDPILYFLGASENTIGLANDYLFFVNISSIFIILQGLINYILLSMGDAKTSIRSTVFGALTNVVLDYILVIQVGIGVKGAAIATMVSQIVGFLYSLIVYLKNRYKVEVNKKKIAKYFIPIIGIGLSAFIIEVEDAISISVLNNILEGIMGDRGIVILGLVTEIYMCLFIAVWGVASAMLPIAAYYMGARQGEKFKELIKNTIRFSFILTLILWAFSMIFAEYSLGMFVKDKSILPEAVRAFRIVLSIFPIVSFYYASIYYYQAAGRVRSALVLSLARQLFVMIPVALILVNVFHMGELGVWLSFPISDFAATMVSLHALKTDIYPEIEEKYID